jgi:hypothetical protein
MNEYIIGVLASLTVVIIVFVWGKVKGFWFKKNNSFDVDVTKKIFQSLNGDTTQKTANLTGATKALGDVLITHYKNGSQYSDSYKEAPLELIKNILTIVKPLNNELLTGSKDLSHLKKALKEYIECLEWTEKTVNHLCNPPNPKAMHGGHVQSQLLDENCKVHDLLQAAKGEIALYLRGYGINCFQRIKYLRKIKKKEKVAYQNNVDTAYRKVLQSSALGKFNR